MTISKEQEAQILRFHHVEKWRVGTIARQLGVHRDAVDRVLSQNGLPKAERASRPGLIDPYLPFVVDTLKQELRRQSITYRQVADALNLSEASIKRIFSEKSFTLERVEAICNLLKLEFTDLV